MSAPDITLHLMTQRGQPYGSERRCCEICGSMMVARSDSFWQRHTWTDNPDHYKRWEDGSANVPGALIPCRLVRADDAPRPTDGGQGHG